MFRMKTSVFKLRGMSARDWAWGPTAYWTVFPPGKSKKTRIESSFIRYMSKTADSYQENVLRVYRNAKNGAKKAIKGKLSGSQSFGKFGFALNSILLKNSQRNARFDIRKAFMHGEADITLSNEEISRILRAQEQTTVIQSHLVSRLDFNELASNRPMEDQKFVFRNSYENGLIIGLLDGHGGSAFGEKVRKYLPLYVSAALIDENFPSILDDDFDLELLAESVIKGCSRADDMSLDEKLLDYVKEMAEKYENKSSAPGTLSLYVRQLLGPSAVGQSVNNDDDDDINDVSDSLREAFMRLDFDVINNILEMSARGELTSHDLKMTSSGCCALVAYINDSNLHVANSGDCRAVMGSLHDGQWAAIQLTNDHTAMSSPDEVQRILAEHPKEESRTCIQYGRLLGRLAPTRAFGDIRFKLDAVQQQAMIGNLDPKFKPFSGLKSPPYLTAEPEVFQYKLERNDKFIVLATDGLWDMLSNQEVVELVGSFMEGRAADAMKNRAVSASISNLDEVLSSQDTSDVDDDNVATYLIRCALGGYDYATLNAMLTLPHPDVRMYRDDISVVVIFFDHENLNDN